MDLPFIVKSGGNSRDEKLWKTNIVKREGR